MSFAVAARASLLPQQTYTSGDAASITLLVVAGIVSILAILVATAVFAFSPRTKTCHRTHLGAYVVCLILANVLQAIGTIMNVRWVVKRAIVEDAFCSAQGGLKNAGNVGTALWSFVIALHVFNLLFLRWETTVAGLYATIIGGWSTILMIVTIGPTIIQTPDKGPYFGLSGYWCWITENYPKEQTFLEYFFEFLSAGLGIALYTLTLLRVRGNLVADGDGRWRLRWVPRGKAWQLSFARDLLDSALLRVAAKTVWYPVAYSIIIVPVALARLSAFMGHSVPFWATIVTDTIFNLTGLVNALLFLATRRVLPDTSELPAFDTPRGSRYEKGDMKAAGRAGITPFLLPALIAEAHARPRDRRV